jgi:23S rRNA (guanosine2251-2'-O)-methyltransferase
LASREVNRPRQHPGQHPGPHSGQLPPVRAGRAEETLLYGLHAVEAALANPARTIHGLYLTDNAERQLRQVVMRRKLVHARVLPRDLDRRLGANTVHQGALLETEPLPDAELAQLVAHGGGPIIVLDQVTDPHNVGAILRSAAALGTAGLIMTRRHSPALAGALAKSASGALEHVPVARVPNLSRALDELKAQHCAVIGLDADAPDAIEEFPWPERAALVLGAEGKGLRHLTRQNCDQLCRITTEGTLTSLNVSNAAAIALHLASVHRRRVRTAIG